VNSEVLKGIQAQTQQRHEQDLRKILKKNAGMCGVNLQIMSKTDSPRSGWRAIGRLPLKK